MGELTAPVIWTTHGLMHYRCWYRHIKSHLGNYEDDNGILAQYYDVATGIKLSEQEARRRFRVGWLMTMGVAHCNVDLRTENPEPIPENMKAYLDTRRKRL